jgi:hypothetical protein
LRQIEDLKGFGLITVGLKIRGSRKKWEGHGGILE